MLVFATSTALTAVRWLIEAYVFVLIARALLSWFPMQSGSPLIGVVRALDRVTEPVLAPVRRLIPPLRAGGMGIDLSFIIVVIVLQLIASRLY